MPYNLDKLIQAIATNQTEHAVFSDEDMSDQQISQLAEAVKKTKSLKKLYFGDEGVSGSASRKQKCKLKDQGTAKLFAALAQNTSVTHVDVSANLIGEAGAAAIGNALTENKTIVSLNLRANKLGDKGVEALCDGMKQNTACLKVDLTDNSLTPTSAKALAGLLRDNNVLIDVNLSHNGFGDEGVKVLAKALERNHSIVRLFMVGNEISNEGAKCLAQMMEKNKTVGELGLTNNKIGDAGVAAIAQALEKNYTITKLHMGFNTFTDVGLKALNTALQVNYSLLMGIFNAETKTNEEIRKELQELRKRNTALRDEFHVACQEGSIEDVKRLLGFQLSLGSTSGDEDNTPLHLASLGGHKELTELLLSEGANPRIPNNLMETPLDLAKRGGNPTLIPLLMRARNKLLSAKNDEPLDKEEEKEEEQVESDSEIQFFSGANNPRASYDEDFEEREARLAGAASRRYLERDDVDSLDSVDLGEL